ncbi:MAG TPA: CHAT domain-containing protein, partial [Pyrinomonadaceae bacterium]|nr:CHAT domain-containing protein [Pyrinomonadaceae bacterium]
MDSVAYLDFDLLIEREGEVYTAQVLNSPAGQASVTFSVPFSALELDNFLLRIGRPRRGTRRIDSPEVSAAKGFGGRLFDAVFNGEVRGCLRSSIDEANRQGRGLRVRLRLTDVPELAELPWEYLYNQPLNRFLALSDRTPLVRYLELPESIRPLTVSPPLRILVMISSPKNFDKLDVEREWENLKEALGDFEGRGLVELERLNEATPGALRRQLRRGQYHVFHFIGHGGFDQQIQDGVLVLEDREGQGRHVSGQDLGTLLYDHHPMRLAVLNACEGARGSRTDPFAGVAQSLLQQGVPAVIAMQFEITDEAAITFAHEFYGAVADNYPVDAALSQARQMIKTEGSGLEWGTPVLYMRAPDGRIFNVKHSSDEDGEQPDIAALYHDAQADIERGEGGLAVEKLRKLLGLAPGHTEASEQLSRALEQQELDTAYRSARELYEAGQWPEALECLNRLQKMRRGYKDVETLTANAESELAKVNKKEQEEKEIEDFYGEAKAAIRAEDWPTAITKLQAILRADRSHVEAAEKLNHAERQQKLSALYTTGRELYEARRLTEALDYLSEAEKIQSNYKDVAALIADAKGKLKRARIASFCQEAQALMNREDWAGAESKLQTLLNLHPGDPDALALLDRVRQGAQIKNFYAEGQSYLAAARWDDALSKFLEVHRLQHDYKIVAALIAEAQSKTTERQKAAQSAALEDEARAEVGKRVADVEKLQALYGTEPDHPRAKAELRAAWQQQQLANLYAEGQRRLAANDLSGALV